MKTMITILLFASAICAVQAQDGYETVLQQIDANNLTLATLRQQANAQKLNNHTELVPANPEIEFNYLWGNSSSVGNRTDISITQTFDFPAAYSHRSKIANLQDETAELLLKAERTKILLSAKQTCIELTYYSALAREYAVRLQNAGRIAAAVEARLEKGETGILEHNKAQLNLAAIQAEVAQLEIEQTALLAVLKQLNGAKEIVFPDTDLIFSPINLPADFDEWYSAAESKSPVLQYVSAQTEIGRQQIKLNRAIGLPRFSAGYMSEKTLGEHFQGITLGMNIPLWENKNRVKQAKAQAQAAEAAFVDTKLQFYNRLHTLFLKAAALHQKAQKLRRSLADNDNEPLLRKALDAGEISLLNYLLETEYYYDTVNAVLETERDCRLAIAELQSVTGY